jgi:hypothetical protein
MVQDHLIVQVDADVVNAWTRQAHEYRVTALDIS